MLVTHVNIVSDVDCAGIPSPMPAHPALHAPHPGHPLSRGGHWDYR